MANEPKDLYLVIDAFSTVDPEAKYSWPHFSVNLIRSNVNPVFI